jgi:hypothetical protein
MTARLVTRHEKRFARKQARSSHESPARKSE